MSTNRPLDKLKELYRYLSPRDSIRCSDLILGFGVSDMRVPAHCTELYHGGYAPLLLFSGGFGAGSGPMERPEAEVFRDAALRAGVPESSILIETASTNTLENVLNSRMLLMERRVPHERIILVAQPHRQRRVWLTCRKWLHGSEFINSPPISEYEAEETLFGGYRAYLSSLAGEVERIAKYGRAGDIVREEIPRNVAEVSRTGSP
jgi:uncharacterized SAM-binding protein YcdF (DUF218 family)